MFHSGLIGVAHVIKHIEDRTIQFVEMARWFKSNAVKRKDSNANEDQNKHPEK